jgi:hypothetical protein
MSCAIAEAKPSRGTYYHLEEWAIQTMLASAVAGSTTGHASLTVPHATCGVGLGRVEVASSGEY